MQLRDMYPGKYLRGQDMTRPMLIEVRGVEKAQLRAGPGKPEETGYVLNFEDVSHGAPARVRGLVHSAGTGHSLVLRRRLAAEIMWATDTSDTDEWSGKRVVIYPEQMTVANRLVTAIRARPPKTLATSNNTAPMNERPAHTDDADDADDEEAAAEAQAQAQE